MYNEKLGYDPASPESIEKFAVQLENKTFYEVVSEKGNASANTLEGYANQLRKGGLGNLLEKEYFGYEPNSNQEADFPEAGVELKTTPYEVTKKGALRAGERLVLTMINYDGPVEADFYKSHAWNKMRLILLIYYWRNKELSSRLLYPIKFVRLFTPPEEDLIIIRKDYDYIINMIQSGRAHELSEGDTMYLGACTKGVDAEKSTVPQYYGDKTPARKRAFCFKNSYMTYVLNHYIVGNATDNAILKDASLLKEKSFEDILIDIVDQYVGMSDKELCERFGREYNNNKAQWNDLACKMLGIRDEHADEFEKANIRVKTIRVEENNKIVENMSFPPFKFMDLDAEQYDESTLHDYFDETRFFFFVWKREGDVYRVKGCLLWNMPHQDLNVTVRREWEEYHRVFHYGVQFFKKYDSNGKISFANNLPKKSDTKIIHVRPHAQKAAYRFKNGEEYGNVERDANVLPTGEYMTTQSFWINNSYILEQIRQLLDDEKTP